MTGIPQGEEELNELVIHNMHESGVQMIKNRIDNYLVTHEKNYMLVIRFAA